MTATFLGTGIYADSVSAVLSHVVSPGQTQTGVAADRPGGVYGQVVVFTATVSVVAPAAGQPAGNVTFQADGNAIGTVPLVNGVATLSVSNLPVGSHSIGAAFVSSNGSFLDSVSSAITYVTARGQTTTDLAADHPSSVYGQTVRFTASVTWSPPRWARRAEM